MATLLFYDNDHTYEVDGERVPSVTELCSVLTASKYPPGAEIIRAAAARGTRVHELCELYDYGALTEFEPELTGYLRAWQAFCRDYRPRWERIEHRMGSAVDSFAGTADRIGIIDRARVVVDIKTTASMDRPSKIALAAQLHGYELLSLCTGAGACDGESMGVQLKKDGSYTVHRKTDVEAKYHFNSDELWEQLTYLYHLTKG